FRSPEPEVLHRPLGEVLPLRDWLRLQVALDDDAAHAALAELNRKPHADWPTADNDDRRLLLVRAHRRRLPHCTQGVLYTHGLHALVLPMRPSTQSPQPEEETMSLCRLVAQWLVTAVCALALTFNIAAAQAPGRTITIVVPFTPGSNTVDIIARILAE